MTALCVPLVAQRGNNIYQRGELLYHDVTMLSSLVQLTLLLCCSCHNIIIPI